MQIDCVRYDCQKVVDVCYWSCKFRKNCKDWQNALKEQPANDAIRERLEDSAKKFSRKFDPDDLVNIAGSKPRTPAGITAAD
ncbi:MAG: hypothetical protein IPG76_18730 [Acidobacteria bacterium]|jgi:hypothetical protein|nr:hypothetical protein [Acidobacteriota bacterium]MBK7599436.1 hypothetical protein [Acidobacteriota bacterium]